MTNDVKDLVEGVSRHNRFANKVWLSLVLATAFVILPTGDPTGVASIKTLPFGLGQLPFNWFYFVSSLIMSVLCIAFCTADAQAGRADRLAHREVDNQPFANHAYQTDPRDVYDATTTSRFDRVAPIAQVLRLKWQFYPEAYDCPRWLSTITAVLYLYLKLLATVLYYILPGVGLLLAVLRFWSAPLPIFNSPGRDIVVLFGVGGAISLLAQFGLQCRHVLRVFCMILRPPRKVYPLHPQRLKS